MTGLLIAIEGLDGSGKSTVATRLIAALIASGRNVLLTREPGGTPTGEQIRRLILDREGSDACAETEALLFAASRAQLVAEVIRPALANDTIVVSDRFTDSSLAYQSGGRGLDLRALKEVQYFATGGLEPDLKILLDIAPEQALPRRYRQFELVNRLDEEDLAFYERVRRAYRDLVQAEPTRWLVVAADKEPDAVWAQVWRGVDGLLDKRECRHTPSIATTGNPA